MHAQFRFAPCFVWGVIAILLLMFVSGCHTVREDWVNVPKKREPTTDLVQYVHTISFAEGSERLVNEEREKLDTFLSQHVVGGPDSVLLTHSEIARPLDDRRTETVRAYLAHKRIPARRVSDGFGIEQPARDTVSVIVRRHVVTLPACPDWTERPGITWNNTTTSNWGCATAVNLGLMVANPADLVDPRAPGPMDGEFASLAIQRYRAGETKPLDPEDVGTIEAQQKQGGGGDSGD
ncbi:MAG: CpaD family pilus assembly protein [Rhodospirillales bacterium]|nr:CpaD family pilus assembly protein [Rhodospirillales bacterium]